VGERDRGERPKKSWREIDAQRDRAGGGRGPSSGPRPGTPQAERASKQYRATLDALFEKGELGKFAEKMASPAPRTTPAPAATPPAAPPADESAARRAPSAAEAKPSPADEARSVLRKKILAAIGRDEISRAVDKYVKAHGMPADFEILEQALEHVKTDRVSEALGALDALLEREKPKRSRTLVSKLRFIEETCGDPELGTRAQAIRQKLG